MTQLIRITSSVAAFHRGSKYRQAVLQRASRGLLCLVAIALLCLQASHWQISFVGDRGLSANEAAFSKGMAAPSARHRQSLRLTHVGSQAAVATALREVVDSVTDFAGNGTAFAIRPGVVPQEPPAEGPVKYDIESFSPGFVVDNVLSAAACRRLVQLCEAIGWRHRWNESLGVVTLYLDEATERQIFERVKPFLPDHMGGRPIGINRRWAVIKYGPGQYMNSHIDGHVPGTVREGDSLQYATGTRSYMTALFWLADDVIGGETVFTFPQGGTWIKIPPKEGAALFFNHGQNAVSNPMHHGGTVESGVKYIVRADVIYGHQ